MLFGKPWLEGTFHFYRCINDSMLAARTYSYRLLNKSFSKFAAYPGVLSHQKNRWFAHIVPQV
jgi:hypothetical protein